MGYGYTLCTILCTRIHGSVVQIYIYIYTYRYCHLKKYLTYRLLRIA